MTISLLNQKGKAMHWLAKTYEMNDPQGNHVTIVNMLKFCKEHPGNLNAGNMALVHSEVRKSHKGWTKHIKKDVFMDVLSRM